MSTAACKESSRRRICLKRLPAIYPRRARRRLRKWKTALLIDGAMSVYDAKVRLGLTESPDGNFNTFAGFVLSIFGRIPSVGERTAWQDWSFEIAEIDGWRIGAVLVRRKISDKPSEERADS